MERGDFRHSNTPRAEIQDGANVEAAVVMARIALDVDRMSELGERGKRTGLRQFAMHGFVGSTAYRRGLPR